MRVLLEKDRYVGKKRLQDVQEMKSEQRVDDI